MFLLGMLYTSTLDPLQWIKLENISHYNQNDQSQNSYFESMYEIRLENKSAFIMSDCHL